MSSRGFTLVELVVALVLFELLLLGAVGTLHLAATHAVRAETLERALWAAEAVADSLAFATGGSARSTAWGWVEVGADRVAAFDSTGRALVEVPWR